MTLHFPILFKMDHNYDFFSKGTLGGSMRKMKTQRKVWFGCTKLQVGECLYIQLNTWLHFQTVTFLNSQN